MRVYIQYPNARFSGDWQCDDIQFVPGFIVLKNARTPSDNYYINGREPITKPIPQWALPTQPILEIRVYDE